MSVGMAAVFVTLAGLVDRDSATWTFPPVEDDSPDGDS